MQSTILCKHLIIVHVCLLRSAKKLIKIQIICIFNMATKLAKLCSNACNQQLLLHPFHVCMWISAEVRKEIYKNLAHLCIQYGYQNGRIMFPTAHFSACNHNIPRGNYLFSEPFYSINIMILCAGSRLGVTKSWSQYTKQQCKCPYNLVCKALFVPEKS